MGRESRSYETEADARQAMEDITDNGASCTYSESGGDSDGTGGEYEVTFNSDSYNDGEGR